MSSVTPNPQSRLSGPHASGSKKQLANSRVTMNPKAPPTIGGKMHLGIKSNNQKATRSRVAAHYPGWGETVHGYEGGEQDRTPD